MGLFRKKKKTKFFKRRLEKIQNLSDKELLERYEKLRRNSIVDVVLGILIMVMSIVFIIVSL